MDKSLRYSRKVLRATFVISALLLFTAPLSIPALVRTNWAKDTLSSILSESLGRSVHINGALKLELDLTPKLTVTELVIDNPQALNRQEMLEVGSLSITGPLLSNLTGSFEIDEINFRNATVHIARDNKARLNWDLSGEKLEKEQDESGKIRIPVMKQVSLKDVFILVKTGVTPHEISFKNFLAKNINLKDTGSLTSSVIIDGIPISLKAGLSSLNRFFGGDSLDFDIDLNQEANQIFAEGKFYLSGATELKVKAAGEDLSSLSTFLGTDLPAYQNYSIESKVNSQSVNQGTFDLNNLRLKLDDNDLRGKASLALSPLSILARLESNNLDLGALSSRPEPEEQETKQKEKPARIPYEIFETVSADIELKAARLKTYLDVELQDAEIAAKLKDGRLAVPKLSAKIFGGSLEGSAEAADRVIKWKLNGKQLDANLITSLAGGEPILEGNFNLALDLVGKGEELPDILETLSGTIELNSDKARVKNTTLHTATSGLAEILSPLLKKTDQTLSECILFNYEVKDGIATSKEQVIKLDDVFIFAEGKIDFPKNELEYNFNVNSNNPALASLIPPFRAFGKLNKPHFLPSVSGSIASVVDSGQEVVGTVFDLAEGATEFVMGDQDQKLTGLAVCKAAYAAEQKLISSRIGKLIEGDSSGKNMHPSWDKDRDGINDCEKDGSCDHTFDYSKPRPAN